MAVFYVFQAPFALNGYMCLNGAMMCYVSTINGQKYWSVDMTITKNISRIIYQGGGFAYVVGTQIRAGLDPNILNDPVVATATVVIDWYWYFFEFETPILARYIGATVVDTYLEVCNLLAFE